MIMASALYPAPVLYLATDSLSYEITLLYCCAKLPSVSELVPGARRASACSGTNSAARW